MDRKQAETALRLVEDLKKYAAIGYGKVKLSGHQCRLLREYSRVNVAVVERDGSTWFEHALGVGEDGRPKLAKLEIEVIDETD